VSVTDLDIIPERAIHVQCPPSTLTTRRTLRTFRTVRLVNTPAPVFSVTTHISLYRCDTFGQLLSHDPSLSLTTGRAMAQAVSRRPLTVPLTSRLGEHHSRPWRFGVVKNCLHPGVEPWLAGDLARSLASIPTAFSWLHITAIQSNIISLTKLFLLQFV
jgi:hypothetical protein